MNLLQNRKTVDIDENVLTVSTFRKTQYDMIDGFINLMVQYVSKQNKNYLQLLELKNNAKVTYQSIYNTNFNQVEVYVHNALLGDPVANKKLLFKLLIPRLIDDNFFMINGNYYVPTLYILDKCIIIKKLSIKLYSLFNSISISLNHDIATFTKANIPLKYFFGLFFDTPEDMELYKELCTKFKLKYEEKTESEIVTFFNNKINRNSRESIIKYFEDLFFDDYTKYLYSGCYPRFSKGDLSLKEILRYSVEMKLENKIPEYIDLEHKRLVFLELFLSPLLKRIGSTAAQAARGFYPDEIRMDQYQILKHFLSSPDKKAKGSEGLSGNYLYDTVNLMSGMLSHKVSMVNPGSTNPPSSISDTHPTHFKRICPIAVSNQRPGEVISVLPTTKFDHCGQFL